MLLGKDRKYKTYGIPRKRETNIKVRIRTHKRRREREGHAIAKTQIRCRFAVL